MLLHTMTTVYTEYKVKITMNKLAATLKNLLDADSEKLSVEILNGYSEAAPGDETVATFLSWLQSFKTLLITARHELGIEPSLGLQFTIFENYKVSKIALGSEEPPLSPKQIEKLNKKTQEILEYFSLTPNWWGSVRMAILVNIIYLPPKARPVMLKKPSEPIKQVAIYITEQISMNELKHEIENIKPQLEKRLNTLPKRKIKKIDDETIKWGQAMWLARKETNVFDTDKPFRLMRTKLVEMLGDDSIPSPTELRKYYERFLNYGIHQQKPFVKPDK